MVYGHYIEDTVGNKRFFVEGCSYCRMSTGGQHESICPQRDVKVPDMEPNGYDNNGNPIRHYLS